MCIKNINATMDLFDEILGDTENRDFKKLFDSIEIVKDDNGGFSIKNIYLILNISIIQSTSDQSNKAENVLNNNGTLNAKIQFVKDGDQDNSLSIAEFQYDFAKENKDEVEEFDGKKYFSQKRILKIETMRLLPNWASGKYRFELLLKRENINFKDDQWILQSFCPLEVREIEEEKTIATEIE